MTALLFAAALLCGVPIGIVIGLVLGALAFGRDDTEFDGGFTDSNPPPVRTQIWYGREEG